MDKTKIMFRIIISLIFITTIILTLPFFIEISKESECFKMQDKDCNKYKCYAEIEGMSMEYKMNKMELYGFCIQHQMGD